jgi:hypothetical protein
MDEDIILILMSGLIVFTPVAGLTLRFALKPLVDSLARLMEIRARKDDQDLLDKRVALLEQELGMARMELKELREREDFYQRLGPGTR